MAADNSVSASSKSLARGQEQDNNKAFNTMTTTTETPAANRLQKSVENTVFVRFVPSSRSIRRQHLEKVFSEIGPIKKCSVIHKSNSNDKTTNNAKTDSAKKESKTESSTKDVVLDAMDDNDESSVKDEKGVSSYGFVKYTTNEDAVAAAKKLNDSKLRVSKNETVRLQVELASVAGNKKNSIMTPSSNNTKVNSGGVVVESNDAKPQSKERPPNKQVVDNNRAVNSKDKSVDESQTVQLKKNCRVILRNLSFYAKESHIREALTANFGSIVEINLPSADANTLSAKTTHAKTHRGFAFVTFADKNDAKACVEAKQVMIRGRLASTDWCENKTEYERHKNNDSNKKDSKTKKEKDKNSKSQSSDKDKNKQLNEKSTEIDNENDQSDDESNGSSDEIENDTDDEKKTRGKVNNVTSEEENSTDANNDKNTALKGKGTDEAIHDGRALFLRNLPFDTTRHDVFELFRTYGHIESIYLVRDHETGMLKGTAFVIFSKSESSRKVLEATKGDVDGFVSLKEQQVLGKSVVDEGRHTLMLKDRAIYVSLAVDKKTADALTMEKEADGKSYVGKDKRNMYLKSEGRIDNDTDAGTDAWDDLPETDQIKRTRAWSEKQAKLRSPLFHINNKRLSIRNLSKQVDEAELKKLLTVATQRGLQHGLVSVEDQVAHWRASGEKSVREIVKAGEEAKENGTSILPDFDEKNVKKFITSVYIDRDFDAAKREGTSRGFAFAEFEHHVHALACLRELNNNVRYSRDYVAGGSKVTQGRKSGKRKKKDEPKSTKLKVPRLIVEFAVENKAKAKQQMQHREQQRANYLKQKAEKTSKAEINSDQKESKKDDKRSRGAVQREKKRRAKEVAGDVNDSSNRDNVKMKKQKTHDKAISKDVEDRSVQSLEDKVKMTKPQKKRKHNNQDVEFSQLVASKQKAQEANEDAELQSRKSVSEKRWFE